MWTLLMICYSCAIATAIIVYHMCPIVNGLNWKEIRIFIETLKSLIKPEHEVQVLFFICYSFDTIAHSIFAMKYWVLSRKF